MKKMEFSHGLCILFKTLKMLIHWKPLQATPSNMLWIWQFNTRPLCSPTGALRRKTMNKTLQCGLLCANPPPAGQTGIITPPHSWQGKPHDGKRWGSLKMENVQGGGEGVMKLESFCFLCEDVQRHRVQIAFRRWSFFTSVSLFISQLFFQEMLRSLANFLSYLFSYELE